MKSFASRLSIARSAALAAAAVIAFPAWSGATGVPGRIQPSMTQGVPGGVQKLEQTDTSQPKVFGRTYGEWAAQWVAWSEAGPVGANAITDTTGQFCADNQRPGHVWFLAGTLGGAAERSCTIPRGRALFYPIVESGWIDCPGTVDETLSDLEVRNSLEPIFSLPAELSGSLNGVPLASLEVMTVRAQSPVFTSVLPNNNIWDSVQLCGSVVIGGGRTGRRIDDGYWVMVPPLPPGQHTLKFKGALSGGFETSVTYHLTVAPN